MLRILLVVLCASGVAIPLVERTGSERADDMWNPAESRAALFQSNPGRQAASYFSATSSTVELWIKSASVLRIALLRLDEPEPQEPDVISVRGINDNDEMRCSSSIDPSPSGATFCSARVPGGGSVEGEDHTDCSAIQLPDATLYCSTQGAQSNIVRCSTEGGQSTGDTDGAVACSAGHVPAGNPDASQTVCSTSSGSQTQTCSTMSGEHQACSAGDVTDTEDKAYCSASGNPTAIAFCSVGASPPAGKYQNKCSAINTSPDSGSTHKCSTNPDGANVRCSVLQSAQSNAACTIINHGDGTGNGAACSAVLTTGTPPSSQTSCSVIKTDGTFESGPINGICGDPNSTGH